MAIEPRRAAIILGDMNGTPSSFRCPSPVVHFRGILPTAVTVLGILLGGIFANDSAMAESASQSFFVTVPTGSFVQRPTETSVDVTLDAAEQSFPAQSWQIRSNSLNGLVVDFAVKTPFVHTEVPTYQMDTSLEVAVSSKAGQGQWTVPKSQSQTNFAGSQADANVRVQTDSTGVADIALTVGVSDANLTEFDARNVPIHGPRHHHASIVGVFPQPMRSCHEKHSVATRSIIPASRVQLGTPIRLH